MDTVSIAQVLYAIGVLAAAVGALYWQSVRRQKEWDDRVAADEERRLARGVAAAAREAAWVDKFAAQDERHAAAFMQLVDTHAARLAQCHADCQTSLLRQREHHLQDFERLKQMAESQRLTAECLVSLIERKPDGG